MFEYEKRLQYPINIKNTNPKMAKFIISQYGGPHGEMGASIRYLSQRYSMPYNELKAALTDIGTEELGHLEMVATIVHQLTDGLSEEQIKANGFEDYFIDHTTGIYPQAASGTPFSADALASTGDTIADLNEDMAAEGTITKEQPVFSIPQKALFHAVFRTFRVLAPNRRLRPHKNNKSQKTIGQAVFKEKYDRLTTGLSDRQ